VFDTLFILTVLMLVGVAAFIVTLTLLAVDAVRRWRERRR